MIKTCNFFPNCLSVSRHLPDSGDRENSRADGPLCVWTAGVIEEAADEMIAGGNVHSTTIRTLITSNAPAKAVGEDTANGDEAVGDQLGKLIIFTGNLLKCLICKKWLIKKIKEYCKITY